MKINIDRRSTESICIFISLALVIALTFLGVIVLADNALDWDLLPRKIENIAYLLMGASGMILGGAFLICMMINFSILSVSMEKIAENTKSKSNE